MVRIEDKEASDLFSKPFIPLDIFLRHSTPGVVNHFTAAQPSPMVSLITVLHLSPMRKTGVVQRLLTTMLTMTTKTVDNTVDTHDKYTRLPSKSV